MSHVEFDSSQQSPLSSRKSVLPHWGPEVYTTYASRFYDTVTSVTGWRGHIRECALAELEPGRLLDVGCGTGYLLSLARDRGFEVRGVEPSGGMLAKAREHFSFTEDELIEASADELPFEDESFDVVLASGVLVHIPSVDAAVREMVRVVRRGGKLRIIDHGRPRRKTPKTLLAYAFLQLSGDIIHDYEHYFAPYCRLVDHKTIGRGGYLQRYDFLRE